VSRRGPPVLHAAVGIAIVVLLAIGPRCSHDECLRDLFLGVTVAVWTLGAVSIRLLTRSGHRGRRIAAWAVPLVWLPIAWAGALGLFLLFPALGAA
jgi:hypothetical protein